MQLEKALYNQLLDNDKKAQLTFYRYCFNVLMRVALRYKKNKDDAAILVNDAFLKILTNLKSYSLEKPLEPWLRRIIINTAIDDYRKNTKHFNINQDIEIENIELQTQGNIEENFYTEEIHKTIESLLPNATKIVFYLYAIDGFLHEEIAENLGISEETSKWHIKNARKILRENKEKILN